MRNGVHLPFFCMQADGLSIFDEYPGKCFV